MLYNRNPPSPPLLTTLHSALFPSHSSPPFGIVCVGYNLITTAFPFSVCVCVWAAVALLSPRWRHKICSFIFTWILPATANYPPKDGDQTLQTPNPNRTQPASLLQPPSASTARGQWNIFGSCRQRLRLVNLLLPNAYLSHLQCAWRRQRRRRHSTIYKQLGSSGTAAAVAVAATARRGSGHQ